MKLEDIKGIKLVKARLPYELELLVYDGDNPLDNVLHIHFSPLFQPNSIKSLKDFVRDLQQEIDKFDKEQNRIDLAHKFHIAVHENLRFKKLADIKKEAIDTLIQKFNYSVLAQLYYGYGKTIETTNLEMIMDTIDAMITSMEEINWNEFYKKYPYHAPNASCGYDIYRAFGELVKKVRLE